MHGNSAWHIGLSNKVCVSARKQRGLAPIPTTTPKAHGALERSQSGSGSLVDSVGPSTRCGGGGETGSVRRLRRGGKFSPRFAPRRIDSGAAGLRRIFGGCPGGRRGSSQAVIVPWSERAPSFLCAGHSVRWTRWSNAHLIGFDVGGGLVQNLAAIRAAFRRSR